MRQSLRVRLARPISRAVEALRSLGPPRARDAARLPGCVGVQLLWLSACAPLADYIERTGNKVAPPPPVPSAPAQRLHESLLVADLHADTFLWRRGLVETNPDGQVDLSRMVKGNLGLQVFTMATQVPMEGRCIHARNFDPAPLLAFIDGWPAPTWTSPYQRALHQAEALKDAVDRSKERASTAGKTPSVRLTIIQSTSDLETWLGDRYRTGQPYPRSIGVLLGAEGAHAFDDPDGPDFETLYRTPLPVSGPPTQPSLDPPYLLSNRWVGATMRSPRLSNGQERCSATLIWNRASGRTTRCGRFARLQTRR